MTRRNYSIIIAAGMLICLALNLYRHKAVEYGEMREEGAETMDPPLLYVRKIYLFQVFF